MQEYSIGKIHFTVDATGLVSSNQFDDLGNMDDCQAFAELVWHLFETLHPNIIL